MTPALLYQSAARTDARRSGPVRRKFPLPAESPQHLAAFAVDQDFEMVLTGQFPPAPKNTPASAAAFGLAESAAILTGYTQPAPTSAGMGKFTGTFTVVPASWDDWDNVAVTFPGYAGYLVGVNFQVGATPVGRATYTPPNGVKCRVHADYFVADPDGVLAGAGLVDSGGNVVNLVSGADKIDLLPVQQWLLDGLSFFPVSGPTLAPAAGLQVGGLYFLPTVPSLETYQTWVAYATASGWASGRVGTADPSPGQFVVDCRVVPYAGNIWARVTRYVLAQ